ncbi:6-phospho-alpha-glucosidase [Clostridium uliginosum]|uniref:6-phospho-beta-glucosidase/maltose-6'-phosphate glucosidase n=1 Tax=Clostridium uliginosum TaxID=119641 RepID=A0A1I1R641_9CLOT|nr:6-phospho-alpha-glucosidase [Clostridium uliginosum]SFD29742.1 6-phospho-beta-glucosidase/maltose-6'-phosphate glucosidase [Clostridium uliginosum]
MKKFILTIAGGGSTYTPGIVKSLLINKEQFPLQELRMYDIDGERQDKVAIIAKEVIKEFQPGLKLVVTTDPKEAFEDSDFIFAQMRVGKYKMRELDEKIPLKYGVVGQETCGPGGLAYGLRTIFPMAELIDLVEKYAKKTYWIVNYSNPAAVVAEAMKRLRPNARIMNICDMPVGTIRNMAAILDVDRSKLVVDYFGLNHFGWFTKVMVEGVDRTDEVRKHAIKHGLLVENMSKVDVQHSDKSWIKNFKNIQYMMELFPEYIPNPYMQYYLLGDHVVEHMDKNHTRANEVIEGREKKLFDAVEEYKNTGKVDLSSFYVGVHGQFIVEVAMSLAFNLRKRFLVIVENNGAVENLSNDAMVEVPAYITNEGPEVVRMGQIPTFYKGLIEQQFATEKLIVDAALEGSYEKAVMALTMSKTVKSALQAKKILDDLIEANKGYWPELK